ncbi:MAG: hypothetical protein GTO63_05705, partial [Anaerolineae bacterium]|nr:hypothetical protein [Anaerolineae bacterium]NIN94467.1 hypothetical protein [Anaerolineae bacterium]NIQ77535.1 hypothetical protein [Anaerolineae bacterium]
MREKLALALCVLVATAVCAVAGETHPYALTARPVNDVAVRPQNPVPFACADPCTW